MQYLEIIYKAKANKNSSRAAVKRGYLDWLLEKK
jgi:hypothetical protein